MINLVKDECNHQLMYSMSFRINLKQITILIDQVERKYLQYKKN